MIKRARRGAGTRPNRYATSSRFLQAINGGLFGGATTGARQPTAANHAAGLGTGLGLAYLPNPNGGAPVAIVRPQVNPVSGIVDPLFSLIVGGLNQIRNTVFGPLPYGWEPSTFSPYNPPIKSTSRRPRPTTTTTTTTTTTEIPIIIPRPTDPPEPTDPCNP